MSRSREAVDPDHAMHERSRNKQLHVRSHWKWRPIGPIYLAPEWRQFDAARGSSETLSKMLSLTRKSDYALVALVSLAERPDELQSARELADRLKLPPAALRNILKDLTREGLLESIQGTSGGYQLALPADQISLAAIICAIEGPVRLTTCCGGDSEPQSDGCRREDSCRIKAAVRGLNQRLAGFLDTVSLADLVGDALSIQTTLGDTLVALETRTHGATA